MAESFSAKCYNAMKSGGEPVCGEGPRSPADYRSVKFR